MMARGVGSVVVLGLALAAGTAPARAWTTERVSVSSRDKQGNSNSEAPSISADGRFVAFESVATNLVPGDTNNAPDIFLRDRQTGITERVSVGPHGRQAKGGHRVGSYSPSVSADGHFVAFYSAATDLVPDDTNGTFDVFVRDRGPVTASGAL